MDHATADSLAAARYLCDRIGVIYRGHLVEVGTAEREGHGKHAAGTLDALHVHRATV